MNIVLREDDNMLQIDFNSPHDLVSFLLEKHIKNQDDKEFPKWETVIFRMSASNGSSIIIDTLISNPTNVNIDNNSSTYLTFNDNLDTFIIEYEKRKHLGLNMEIKLRFPESFKKAMDPYDNFNAFYLNFFIEGSKAFILTSFMEKDKKTSVQPIKNWIGYVAGLYKKWEEWHNLQGL